MCPCEKCTFAWACGANKGGISVENIIDRLNEYSAQHQCHGGICAEAADYIKELEERVKYAETGWERALDSRTECEGKCQEATYRAEDAEKRAKECEALALEMLGDTCDLARLQELVEADLEGRCVVLPCKIEDDVYINLLGKTLPFSVISISQMASTPTLKAMHGVRLCYIFKADDVGKTVFRTREAAEQALRERSEDG